MPGKRFALDEDGPERIEVSWQGNWKDLTVCLDGQIVCTFESQKDLRKGQEVNLADGSRLKVQLAQTGLLPELQLLRDGEPLPGSASDPAQRLAIAAGVLFFVGGFNVIMGFLAATLNIGVLVSMGLGFPALASGLVYAALGYFVRRRSLVALIAAVTLFVLDGVFFVATASQHSRTPPVAGLFMRGFLLILMFQGFGAIAALKARERRGPRVRRTAARPPAASGRTGPAAPRHSGADAGSIASGAPTPVARPAPNPTLERRRLELSRVATPADHKPAGPSRRIEIKSHSAVDSAAAELRFVARRCEIAPVGLRVSFPNGRVREVAWADLAALVVRQLPPDPPWDAQLLLDLATSQPEPVRIFSTTAVNYAALPGGASSSRLDNLRKLAAHVAASRPEISIDPETQAFIQGKPATRFVTMAQFAEYDVRYG